MKCTGILYEDRDWNHEKPHLNFCRCPACKGFLSKDFPDDKPFTCKKCGTELMVFTVSEEENEEHGYWDGKICPLSQNKHTKKMKNDV